MSLNCTYKWILFCYVNFLSMIGIYSFFKKFRFCPYVSEIILGNIWWLYLMGYPWLRTSAIWPRLLPPDPTVMTKVKMSGSRRQIAQAKTPKGLLGGRWIIWEAVHYLKEWFKLLHPTGPHLFLFCVLFVFFPCYLVSGELMRTIRSVIK